MPQTGFSETQCSPAHSPHSGSIGLAPEGWPIIGLLSLTAVTFAAFGCWPVALIALILTWFSAFFFRDPERVIPAEPGLAISPADGRIVRVERRKNPLTDADSVCVSIFMNVFSVHVNRAPVAGQVERICHIHGAFFNAAWDKASTDNERCAYLLRDTDGESWTMVQIAGLVARRIVCRIKPGTNLERGERYGMIRFGSRVDLYLPENHEPTVTVGERVFAGESVLARKK